MKNYIFRQYDIRGIVDVEFTIADMYTIAQACAYYLHSKKVTHIALGRDGRMHSLEIHTQFVQAFQEAGFFITDIGCCTTPLLYFAAHTLPVQAGLMITASHNNADYNGLKLVIHKHSVSADVLEEIKYLTLENKKLTHAKNLGEYTQVSLLESYVTCMSENFAHLKNSELNVIIDCSHGPGGFVLKRLRELMGWQHIKLLFDTLDGRFPAHNPDPTIRENLAVLYHELQNSSAILGFGLDGDADRVAVMTKDGELVQGDKLLALFARSLAEKETGFTVVGDAKSSYLLQRVVAQNGNFFVMAPCGHAVIKRVMNQHQALLGGELSGHFIFNDRYFGFDDGIYALCRVLEILTTCNAEQLFDFYPASVATPEIRIEIPEEEKYACIEAVKHVLSTQSQELDLEISIIDGVRITTQQGWLLLRAANTQPALSIRFEAETQQDIVYLKKLLSSILMQAVPQHAAYICEKLEHL